MSAEKFKNFRSYLILYSNKVSPAYRWFNANAIKRVYDFQEPWDIQFNVRASVDEGEGIQMTEHSDNNKNNNLIIMRCQRKNIWDKTTEDDDAQQYVI